MILDFLITHKLSRFLMFIEKTTVYLNSAVKCQFSEGVTTEVFGHRIQEIHVYFKGICKECSTIKP